MNFKIYLFLFHVPYECLVEEVVYLLKYIEKCLKICLKVYEGLGGPHYSKVGRLMTGVF